ncbi:MAG TPA: aminopeptidase P family N-terminal domain-containing protein, partial [Trichococcus flocculiformis]|nr:aminopeptidase P family N-terminal domain-containing protein [Trichococcus flocculiformis]
PALEENDARKTAEGFDVISYMDTQDSWTVLATNIKERYSSLSGWSIEKDFLTVERMETLRKHFPTATFSTSEHAPDQIRKRNYVHETSRLLG